MPKLELPDGRTVDLPEGEPVAEVLPGDAIAARFGDALVDLRFVPSEDGPVAPVTLNEPDGLHVLRHSTAHVMAQAVCDLFEGAKYAIGPPIEDGFYYDFDLPETLTPEDLPRVEERMAELVTLDQPFVREELSRDAALERFADQPYKREIIESLDESEGALGDRVSVYRNNGWSDLCLGPHVPSSGRLGAFKLLSVAGAYWRGDEHRPQLQRIYGTVWPTAEELEQYLWRTEEAKRRDHRRLGRDLRLYFFDEVAPGQPFMLPRGMTVLRVLEALSQREHASRGYQEISTPSLVKSDLWEQSGHWGYYRENMFTSEVEDEQYAFKPMNCPESTVVFRSDLRSYRELPLRLSETSRLLR